MPGSQTSVFSYYSNRSGADVSRGRYEPPATHRRGLQRLRHAPTVIALVVIAGSLIYTSLLNTKPRVMVVSSNSDASFQRPTDIYEVFITKELSRSPWHKSKLTFNGNKVTQNIQKQFPEVARAVVTVPIIGHRPVVHIAVARPAFVLATTSGAYYMSNQGVPLVRVSDVESPLPNMTMVSDETGLPVKVGEQALPVDTVLFISDVIAHMNAMNEPVASITLPLEANELRIRLPDKPYYVRFNTQNDARVQVGTLLAVVNRLQGSGEVPQEYIDVRVEERAYYK